jgi:hypothetical protein
MPESTKRRRRLFFLLVCGLGTVFPPPAAFATEPFPPTVIRQEDGKWQLQAGYLGGGALSVVDAKGRIKLVLGIVDALPKDNYEKYVGQTTAGPLWADYALSYFITLDGKPHFGIRTWWSRRILIDLEAGKQVSDLPFEQALADAEKQQALASLRRGVTLLPRWQQTTRDQVDAVHAAAHFAGRAKLREAVPLLRQLEPVDYLTLGIGGGYEFKGLGAGDINPAEYCLNGTRRVVQRSLRQLGEKPAGYPATSFRFLPDDGGPGKDFKPKETAGQRHEAVPKVETGMRPVDVLNLLGPPDYVERGKELWGYAWRYDLDAPRPYSLLVVWDGRARVERLEKAEPPLWQGNDLIGPGVKHPVFGADGSIVWAFARTLYSADFKGRLTKVEPAPK